MRTLCQSFMRSLTWIVVGKSSNTYSSGLLDRRYYPNISNRRCKNGGAGKGSNRRYRYPQKLAKTNLFFGVIFCFCLNCLHIFFYLTYFWYNEISCIFTVILRFQVILRKISSGSRLAKLLRGRLTFADLIFWPVKIKKGEITCMRSWDFFQCTKLMGFPASGK